MEDNAKEIHFLCSEEGRDFGVSHLLHFCFKKPEKLCTGSGSVRLRAQPATASAPRACGLQKHHGQIPAPASPTAPLVFTGSAECPFGTRDIHWQQLKAFPISKRK